MDPKNEARKNELPGLFSFVPSFTSVLYGGGGDRTRISSDGSSLINNDLCKRINGLAAQWLQSAVSDEHDLARIVTVAESWCSLSESQKTTIISLLGV